MPAWDQPIVIEAVRNVLRGWPGFRALETAMDAVPEVDVFLAGGAVRNALDGRARRPKDFDLFIGGPRSPDFVERLACFGRVSYGPFGSPRWFPADGGPYADVIQIERFDNGVERSEDIVGALRQFDFTANAVAVDLRSDAFHDPCGGVGDYLAGMLRAVRLDFPDEPIAKGHGLTRMAVLWMRLMHYSATLDLRPDEPTRIWLAAHSGYARHRHSFATTFFVPSLRMQTLAPA